MKSDNLLRVFAVGCPRSGTTLIQSFLGASDSLITFTESRFFDKHFRSGKYYSIMVKNPLPRIREFLAENRLEADELSKADFLSCGSALRPADWGRRLIGLLDNLAIGRGKTGWIEKTPDHLFRIPFISKICPSARFVHIIREPRANMVSLYEAGRQWGKPRSWLTIAVKWRYAAGISMACSKDRQRHYAVFYDDIFKQPEQEIRNLYDWLGLEWHSDILQNYKSVADKIRRPDEVWKANNSRPLQAYSEADRSEIPIPKWMKRILELQYSSVRRAWERE